MPVAESRLPAFDPLRCVWANLSPNAALEEVRIDGAVPTDLGSRVLIYSIHDGDLLPNALAGSFEDRDLRSQLEERFVDERDFGADAVAAELARGLGCAVRLRNRLARVVLDVGRFFGIDTGTAGHLERLAVPSFADGIQDEQIDYLRACYNTIDARIADTLFEQRVAPRIAIGVHTFDPTGRDGAKRPAISLLSTPQSVAAGRPYLTRYRDPVIHSTDLPTTAAADWIRSMQRRLTREGFQALLDDPYLLPDGSVEVRLHHARRVRSVFSNEPRNRGVGAALHSFVLEVRKDLLLRGRQRETGFVPADFVRDGAKRLGRALATAVSESLEDCLR